MWMELHCLGPHCYPTTLHVPTHFLSHFQAFIWTQCRHTTLSVSIAMPRPGIQSRVWPSLRLLQTTPKKNLQHVAKFKLMNRTELVSVSCFTIVSLQGLVVWDCSPWQWGCSSRHCVFFLPPVSSLTLLWHNGTAPHQRAVQSERDGQSQ